MESYLNNVRGSWELSPSRIKPLSFLDQVTCELILHHVFIQKESFWNKNCIRKVYKYQFCTKKSFDMSKFGQKLENKSRQMIIVYQ